MGILMREIGALYKAYSRGEENPLAPQDTQYADYAAWQRQWLSGQVLEEQSQYWQRSLSGAPALLELPIDCARPSFWSSGGR